jgi:hypothetical protein
MEQVWERRLSIAATVFAIGCALHTADHLRRGQGSITETLYVLGNVSLVLEVVAITLVLAGHRRGPEVGAAAGTSLAIGFAAAHWLPRWSDLSDPLWEIETLAWFSYLASTAEILGAAAFAACGFAVWRSRAVAVVRGA